MAITLSSTLPSGTDVQEIGANASGGMRLGASATEKVALYGATAVAQQTVATAVATTAATSTTNAYGYTTAAQADAIVSSLNQVITALRNLGVMASS